jgi:hypothetical protein
MPRFKMLSSVSIDGTQANSPVFTHKSIFRKRTTKEILGNPMLLPSIYCSMTQSSGSIPPRGGAFSRRSMGMEAMCALFKPTYSAWHGSS